MNYINDFLDFCTFPRGLSENTIRAYRNGLTIFFKWLQDQGLEAEKLKVRDIDPFVVFLKKDGNSIPSINQKMYSVRMFYKWLLRTEVIEKSPLQFFQNIKTPKRLPKFLTLEQQQALLDASHGRPEDDRAPWLRHRDHLMILCLVDLGLRVSELCGVLVENLNLEDGTLRVVGKGDRERICVLSNRLQSAIKKYLEMVKRASLRGSVGPLLPSRGVTVSEVARKLRIKPTSLINAVTKSWESGVIEALEDYVKKTIEPKPIKFLFFNAQGKPLGSRHCFRLVREVGRRAGIEALHPHLLRHSYATNLRRKRADLLLIKEALGHASVSTTEIYSHIENQDYMERMRELVN